MSRAKLRVFAAVAAACALAAAFGAGSAAGTAPPVAAGTATPARVVSLTPSVTEMVFALGAGSSIVAVSDYCDFPPEVAALPRVGSFLAPTIERVISLQPDLVLTSPSPGNRNSVEAIERAGVRVGLVSEGSESLEDALGALAETARLVGRGELGEALVAQVRAHLAHVGLRVARRPALRTALVVDFDPLVLAGSASYLGELIELAGGVNVADALGGKWPRSGWEFLLATAPEVIIDLSQAARTGDGLARWQRFAEIPAVRHGRVHAGEGAVLLRPGPRLGLAAESLARVVHPESWAAQE
jgi:iron complex transport system substrate-binding protein